MLGVVGFTVDQEQIKWAAGEQIVKKTTFFIFFPTVRSPAAHSIRSWSTFLFMSWL